MSDQTSPIVCQQCQEKELQQTKNELSKCRNANAAKENEIKKKDKKVFILMCIIVGIGAIFGKETLDSISAWLESIGSVRSGIDDMTSGIVPGPGGLMVATMGLAALRPRRK